MMAPDIQLSRIQKMLHCSSKWHGFSAKLSRNLCFQYAFSVNVLIQRLRLKSQSFQFSSISSSSTFSRKQPENTQRATNESKKNTDDNRMINRTSIGCYPPFLSMSYLKIPTLWETALCDQIPIAIFSERTI